MLHPIRALDHVIEEYRDYLLTEFRARDPHLKAALEAELDREGFLAQEPFFQSHRPFKEGTPWKGLPIEPKLARVLEERTKTPNAYLHQSLAIERLLGAKPGPVVVTTGTGSGKTECFLLPVFQNAIDDATHFKQSGLTAILVYPMNALANDQFKRIEEYLEASGFGGVVKVAKYDRGTTQSERESLRKNPPHILLTNYMMLEYLLVRPSDRDGLFANHRCRFLVLDEVHTYRGTLGSNIALLTRRFKAHLDRARQDWLTDPPEEERSRRYPELIPVGASATIRSLDEEGRSAEEIQAAREEEVQTFFSKLTGAEPKTIVVIGEELQEVEIPGDAVYPAEPAEETVIDTSSPEEVRKGLCRLGGLAESTSLEDATRRCRILWDLNAMLARKPMSFSQLATRIRETVPERREATEEAVKDEIRFALNLGAALPEDCAGGLRLRVHRFVRGGWRFHRCLNPECGKLYPMGEERCGECNHRTAPLYLCRNCGADYLRLVGDNDAAQLRPSADPREEPEWMLYDSVRLESTAADTEEADEVEDAEAASTRARRRQPRQMRRRPVLHGSIDPGSLLFSTDENDYSLRSSLAPARTQCLCCGGSAGSKNIVTPVALGTSAAVKVLSEGLLESLHEAHADSEDPNHKDRLLLFSDSRQDASHQARFIYFASRYDRMRRRLTALLGKEGPLTIQRAVELLGNEGINKRDNPNVPQDRDAHYLPDSTLTRIQVWEEAPILDELAVNAGYRATLVNLGLLEVRYNRLDEYVAERGQELADGLGLTPEQLVYVCRILLDEMRTYGCLNRELLRYHPANPTCPDYLKSPADWERKMKQPSGYPVDGDGRPKGYQEANEVPSGITVRNAWRKEGAGGRSPRLERVFRELMGRFGSGEATGESLLGILEFLRRGSFVVEEELHGARERTKLLQVNHETIILAPATEPTRCRCSVCSHVVSGAAAGLPCPHCHGSLVTFTDAQVSESRYVRRIRMAKVPPLVAREHTAQVTHTKRTDLEEAFKSGNDVSPVNVLACSPTLEMGIDVGGLDAAVMRNIPPRPDNYAQRGGRAGRRQRIGLVVGYARSTPHDQYFFDKPAEMIGGEVPTPCIALGNRDVIFRHLNAIVFSLAEPGLAGKMVEYVSPTGEANREEIDKLIEALTAVSSKGLELAVAAWGPGILEAANLNEEDLRGRLMALPGQIENVVARTIRQVVDLRRSLDEYSQALERARPAMRAGNLVARLLGIRTDSQQQRRDADDRSSGYPLRRFAEFGILPGYEFPSEPASLRLLGDQDEDELISTSRRFGIGQFRPQAEVYARSRRWRVVGLDTASPWNPYGEELSWPYRVCGTCNLRYDGREPRCRRCGTAADGPGLTASELGGFLAIRQEAPVLDEEDRYASRNLVRCYPQWNGDVTGRWTTSTGWGLRLSTNEQLLWLNEGSPLGESQSNSDTPRLHEEAAGYLICNNCGHLLKPAEESEGARGRRQARRENHADPYGHSVDCSRGGNLPAPLAIAAQGHAEVLRLVVPVPKDLEEDSRKQWGYSMGYALRRGMLKRYALDEGDVEFELEGPWSPPAGTNSTDQMSLTFIDPNLGGSGYLERIAGDFHSVADSALEHLDHGGCETACYRCLKAYENQRFHEYLNWPRILGDLEQLRAAAPERRPAETGDIDNPKPWLDAYEAGVGSPLELKFLQEFEALGFHPEKQVEVSQSDSEPAISIADFAVPDRRIAIYIDGAAFHVGPNFRRDRFIRDRLRNGNPPWTVVELRAADLSRVREVVNMIKM